MSTDNQFPRPGDIVPFFIVVVCVFALIAWEAARMTAWRPAAQAADDSVSVALTKALADQRTDVAAAREKLRMLEESDLSDLEIRAGRAKEVQKGLEKLCLDLLELAKTEPAAARIIKRYDIKPAAD